METLIGVMYWILVAMVLVAVCGSLAKAYRRHKEERREQERREIKREEVRRSERRKLQEEWKERDPARLEDLDR